MLRRRNDYEDTSEEQQGSEVRRNQYHQQGELLKTITDDYDPSSVNGYRQPPYDMREGDLREIRDKPSLISPEYIEGQDR